MEEKRSRKIMTVLLLTGMLMFGFVHSVYATGVDNGAQGSDSHDSKLKEFDIYPGTLDPAFSPDVLEYTATVEADVTSVSVKAIPRASNGTIASVEGAKTLQPGANTVKVTCSAQDYTVSVYTITITVGSADAGQPEGEGQPASQDGGGQDAGQPEGEGQPAADPQPEGDKDTPPEDGDTDPSAPPALLGAVSADGTVVLDGASYQLSGNFTYGSYSQDIPSAFGEGSVQIADKSYPTLYCEASGVHLVYMENTDGNGSTGFYYYDEQQNAVERFKYAGDGENFVVFISSARAEAPEGYQETTFTMPSGKDVAAYQNASSEDMRDFYLIYGIHSKGSDGWYLYDSTQDTYLRYVQTAAPEGDMGEDEEIEPGVSLDKYNLLNEKYTKQKNSMVRIVSILVIVLVLMIIVFTAILLRGKDDDGEETGRPVKEKQKKKRPAKTKKQAEPISKSSLAAGRALQGKHANGEAKKITGTYGTEPVGKPESMPAGQGHIASPDEIRAQQSRMMADRAAASAPQMSQGQGKREQPSRTQAQPVKRKLLKKDTPEDTQESVQLAAEKMRQSMQLAHREQDLAYKKDYGQPGPVPGAAPMPPEAAAVRQTTQKAYKKKRSLADEDMEIMDLNDL